MKMVDSNYICLLGEPQALPYSIGRLTNITTAAHTGCRERFINALPSPRIRFRSSIIIHHHTLQSELLIWWEKPLDFEHLYEKCVVLRTYKCMGGPLGPLKNLCSLWLHKFFFEFYPQNGNSGRNEG